MSADEAIHAIRAGTIGFVVGIPDISQTGNAGEFRVRRAAAERRVVTLTNMETAFALVDVVEDMRAGAFLTPQAQAGPAPLA
jgi:hypothetical protein